MQSLLLPPMLPIQVQAHLLKILCLLAILSRSKLVSSVGHRQIKVSYELLRNFGFQRKKRRRKEKREKRGEKGKKTRKIGEEDAKWSIGLQAPSMVHT